ncbi:YD repeat-containing protein [Pseudomonas sp. ATCC 13867]|uniref:RHS repeat protein n=1 Tax=Pseudomonas sp. ATCC 13867 TaxID=1294143 RepID=UPI0002C4E8AB|nr:RHS repeat protein [Pseudomonas sp. ATCC 13867]AGI26678.1 YD repeat-containing protein [Pseudomonas sp. ATCC 13867]
MVSKRAIAVTWMVCLAGSQYLAAAEEFNSAAVGSYQDPGFNADRNYASDGQVDSVDPFSGALKIQVRDLVIPGNGGMDIEILRNYQSVTNSVGPYSNGYAARTPFGTGWDLHFGRIWVSQKYNYLNQADTNHGCQISEISSSLNPILELPDGSRQVLANGDGNDYAFITKSRWIGRCLPTSQNKGDGGLLVFSPDGRKYIFNLKGTVSPDQQLRSYFVTRIEDADGNALDFSYNITSSNQLAPHHLLKRISASDGRTVSFSYSDESGTRATLSRISANGRYIDFDYVDANWGQGAKPHYLSAVKYPDGTRWTYSYNNSNSIVGTVPGRFSMTAMTSPARLKTSYDYDVLQLGVDVAEKLNVIKRRTLSGVTGVQPGNLVWEYTYTKGYSPGNDQTVERGPLQCITYEHVGTNTIANGASGVDQGLWKVGNLVRKSVAARGCGAALRTETYTWDRQDISGQKEMRRYNLLVENSTRAPILKQRVITQDGSTYITGYTYDRYGQPLTVSEQGQGSRTTSYTYTRPGGLWMLGKVANKTVSGIPGSISNSYTNSGRLSHTSRYGVATRYTYTPKGDLASETDANGRVAQHSDYYRGIAKRTVQPDGGIIGRAVNATGTLASLIDPLGRVTSYAYDAMNRVTMIQLPKSSVTRYDIGYNFTSIGVTETATRVGYTRVRQYNSLGHLISQKEQGGPSPIVSNATYQADGQKVFLSLPGYAVASSNGERFEYDGLGRRKLTRHADGTSISVSYGSNSETSVDERGNQTRRTYASYGDPVERGLIRIEQPASVTTIITRDHLGRVTALEQGGLKRTYTYDSRGFLASEFNPETQTTTYGYDAVGNRTSQKVGAADADYFAYDAMNRLTARNLAGGQTFAFSYDLGGRLLRQTSYQGTVWDFTYNAHDQIIQETLTLSTPRRSFSIGYGYNSLDQLHTITYPSGLQVFYNPDIYGRPTQAGSFASTVAYYPNGALKSLTFASGRTLTVGQDPQRLHPTDRRVGGLTQLPVPMAQRYLHDGAGNLTQQVDEVDGRYNQVMSYDGLDRLTGSSGIWGNAIFAYNNRNDLTAQNIGGRQLNYGYDSQGRLASIGGTLNFALTYNNRGNTTQGRSRYTYNSANQMMQFCIDPKWDCPSPTESYIYDPRGYRSVTTFATGIQELALYGQDGRLLREDFPADGGFVEHIYLAGERVASRMQCEFVDSNGNGVSNCQERRYPVAGRSGTVF